MNKEQTLAAHRIKAKLATAAKNEAKAKTRILATEAKVKQLVETCDTAKKVVDQHKKTLELAKKQLDENKELIKRYETLLNMKYSQVESLKKQVKTLTENKKVSESASKQLEECKNSLKELTEKYNHSKKLLKAKFEQHKTLDARHKSFVEKLQKLVEEKEKRVVAKPVPEEEQAVKTASATKAKVEAKKDAKTESALTNEQITKISKMCKEKYGIPEKLSLNVLNKYPKNEAVVKLQSLANSISKYSNESKRVNESATKKQVNESANVEGTSLYSLFL